MGDDNSKLEDTVIEMRSGDDAPSQTQVAEELGISQSKVSRIERAYNNGREAGVDEGFSEAMQKVRDFQTDDETDTSDSDEYWCGYCDGKVEVDYLADSCPNGHDLSDDWGDL